jgi:hypothetical protein
MPVSGILPDVGLVRRILFLEWRIRKDFGAFPGWKPI